MARRRARLGRNPIPAPLRVLYQLIRKYPGVSTPRIVEMTTADDRLEGTGWSSASVNTQLRELRDWVASGRAPTEVARAVEVHDMMSRSGLGDAFRYLVRAVEREEYYGLVDIQEALGQKSASFQRKFNTRLPILADTLPEVDEIWRRWLELRYISNPIVKLHRGEW